ncbi:helix-turn-helix transcriptional regulator [Planomonospora sp. ID82291]|uniref:helix-turn-helix transcriptional regulator n=1 Tax=Planomonospora sp. ID82291 TaxID=2738136 RepID=UPI001A28E84E|nr:helix-turn-helix transcriptional regulator [Planomonospora sp. ID82291]MBG0814841.1 helix-turn-helix transcriptional regulator [Planomonospora sp. ID82291]
MSEAEPFGAWLGRQLRRKGMSQADLAARLDVTRAAVSAWITGRAEPRLEKIQVIEEILGLTTGASVIRSEAPDSAGSIDWYHRPAYTDGGRELGNAAAFAFDSNLAVLAREATQNSIDEWHDRARPVRVRYVLHELTGERLYRFLDALRWNDLMKHFEAAADRRQKVGRVLANGLQELRESSSLLLLRVDDYNASGLTGPEYDDGKFAAVVRRQLDSHKGRSAGGSFGLGKATLWATSRFGLVLMHSTLSEPHEGRRERRLIGRLDLPWRSVDGRQYAGPAWLGEADPQREGAARSWWADERTVEELHLTRASNDPGTSFLIIGAHDATEETLDLEKMHGKLVQSLAANFWASMVTGRDSTPMLEASVEALRDGQTVIAEERVDPHRYEPARSRAVRAFLNGETVTEMTTAEDVVLASVPLTVPPRKDVGRADPEKHRAVLLVTSADDDDDDRRNRLVCMRSNRMVVMERPVSDIPLGTSPFQAVLLAGRATGQETFDAVLAEEFLRAAEPPEHNDWKQTDDLTASYARGAASRIREFRRAMLDQVRAVVRPPEVKTDETPPVLRELLRLDPPPPNRSPGFPTIKSAIGSVGADGAWHVRVEVRLPEREDPWLLSPVLRFATRSGPRPQAEWAELTAESNCEVISDGRLRFTGGARTAAFTGVSAVESHPVSATMAMAEVDLVRVKERTS